MLALAVGGVYLIGESEQGRTYVSVEPFHLFRYLDEQTFRFNSRKANDLGRFLSAIGSIFGRRVLYRQLIGETR